MRQLQLFTSAALAQMRDRTASRHYSPGHDEFRRGHERRRAWGLIQRHGERLRHLRDRSCASPAADAHESRRPDQTRDLPAVTEPAVTAIEQAQCLAQGGDASTRREPSRCGYVATPARRGQPDHVGQGDRHEHAEPPRRPTSVPSRRRPARSPLLTASPASGRSGRVVRPQRSRRRPFKIPSDIVISVALRVAIHHPDISSRRSEKHEPTVNPRPRTRSDRKLCAIGRRHSPTSSIQLLVSSLQDRGPAGLSLSFRLPTRVLRLSSGLRSPERRLRAGRGPEGNAQLEVAMPSRLDQACRIEQVEEAVLVDGESIVAGMRPLNDR